MFPAMNRLPLLLSALIGFGAIQAQAQSGQTSVPFLRIEPNSRASALGNTGVAMADGDHAAFWNPAWLGSQSHRNFSLSRYDWMSNIDMPFTYNHLSVSGPIRENWGMSAYITYFDLGQQMATDATGNDLGLFGNYEMVAGLAAGTQMTERWSFGAGLKYVRSSIGAGQVSGGETISAAQTAAVDLSAGYRTGFRSGARMDTEFRAGIAVRNLGPGVRYMDGQSSHAIPSDLRVGWAYEMRSKGDATHRVTVSNDVTKLLARRDSNPLASLFTSWGSVDVVDAGNTVTLNPIQQLTFGAGAEYWYQDAIALRGGYYTEHRLNGDRRYLTLGTGLRYRDYGIDLGYLVSAGTRHPLDNTLRITLKLNLAAPKPIPAPIPCDCPVVVPVIPAPVVIPEPVPVPVPAVVLPAIPDLSDAIVRFDVMTSEIKDQHVPDIERVVRAMKADSTLLVRLSGHADITGDLQKNVLLGESRARAVALELAKRGVGIQRVLQTGYSDLQPVGDNALIEGRALNRRTEFHVFRGVPMADRPAVAAAVDPAPVGTPVKSGNDLRFETLQWIDQPTSGEWIASVAERLRLDADLVVVIGTRIRRPDGRMPNYYNELEKARSEKVMEEMVFRGIDPNRIRVVTRGEASFEEDILPHLGRRLPEQTVVIIR